jgi:ABC-2 type transport system ATP-binding protein
MTDFIIQLRDLTKKYDNFTAVDHLNLNIKKGEIFGLLGPNGAGKSTTILMMLGLTDPTSGVVNVCGINSTTNPIGVKQKVSYLPEDVGFYDDNTAMENLIYTAQLNSISVPAAQQKATELLSRVGLSEVINKKTGKFSRGMRQRLGLADVLMKNPEVIILDEPTSGIDPKGVQDFLNLIKELRDEHGLSVIFSSHNLHQVQEVCDRVGILVGGKLQAEGDLQSLSQKLFTKGMYLIEVGIDTQSMSTESRKTTNKEIYKLLESIDGVVSIKPEMEFFQIECSHDLSGSISRTLIEAGLNLNFLNRKEYGLDEIYNHYFEGGINHE